MKARKFWMIILPIALLAGLVLGGCVSDGNNGKSAYDIAVENGFTGTEEEWLASLYGGGSSAPGDGSWFGEYCLSCHANDGSFHQANYDELYQDGVIVVSGLAYASTGGNDVVTFEMTKHENPFDCTDVENLNIYFTPYTDPGFELASGRLSIKGTLAYADSTNVCTSTKAESALGDLDDVNGFLIIYGRDETISSIPGTRVSQARYPYAAVEELGPDGVDYVSAANAAGCEKCHTVPFLKHGYIYGQVDGDADTDFFVCKACHLDDGEGGHFIWQLLVEDPQLIITLEHQYGEDWEDFGTDPRLVPYAYKTSLMNDVHMSHAMEFPYPQSMSNCATCHEGKLGMILAPENFRLETCKSCHPLFGDPQNIMHAPGLWAEAPTVSGSIFNHLLFIASDDCTVCHTGVGTAAPSFDQIHTGYDPVIYTDDNNGTKWSDVISVNIDSVDYDGTDVTIQFSVDASGYSGDMTVNIEPYRIYVGLYGQGTKDFLDEANVRSPSAYIDTTAVPWQATIDVSEWAYLIDDGNERAEIVVMVEAEADGDTIAVDAVSRTFDLMANGFIASPEQIVRVDDGCNNCHDALGTTFHSPARGGSVVVCRVCHNPMSPGSHLEMQSRSIDSYVHAIHSFQPFDIGDIDFEDPVEELHYEHHIGFVYPTLGFNCESCHEPGTYDVPSQYDSMPGLLSRSDDVEWRTISDVPEYVTGPASRACGSCHRVQRINADDAAGLAELNQHIEDYGYLWENDADDVIRDFIIDVVFSVFAP